MEFANFSTIKDYTNNCIYELKPKSNNAVDKIELAKLLSGLYTLSTDEFMLHESKCKYKDLNCIFANFVVPKNDCYELYIILSKFPNENTWVNDIGDRYMFSLSYKVIYMIASCDKNILEDNEHHGTISFLKKYIYNTNCDETFDILNFNEVHTFRVRAARKDIDTLVDNGLAIESKTNWLLSSNKFQFLYPQTDIEENVFITYCNDCIKMFNITNDVKSLGSYVIDHTFLTISDEQLFKIRQILNNKDNNFSKSTLSLLNKIIDSQYC